VWYPPSSADIEEWVATVAPRFPKALAARARRHGAATAQAAVSAGGTTEVETAVSSSSSSSSLPSSSDRRAPGGAADTSRGCDALHPRVRVLEELVAQLSAEVLWLKAKVKAL